MPALLADNWDTPDMVSIVGSHALNHGDIKLLLKSMNATNTNPDAVVRDNAFYGMGAGQISLATVSCEGRENRLFDCPFSTNIICTHSQDVGVVCSTESELLTT